MSEKAPKLAPAVEAKDNAKKDSGVTKVVRKEIVQRHKNVWTLERVLRYARRYETEALWASGAPASYKSALAHGWRDEAVRAQAEFKKGGKVLVGDFKKKSPSAPNKRAA